MPHNTDTNQTALGTCKHFAKIFIYQANVYKKLDNLYIALDGFVKPIIIMTENLNFGQAIEALKQGQRVARQEWNSKGMHIFLEEHFTALFNMGGRKLERKYEPVICMWTAQQTTQPGWLASQADILANDWCIVD